MPITFACACGKTLRVNDDLAGKKARCPGCQSVVGIPSAPPADPGFDVVDGPPVVRKSAPARGDDPAFDDEDRPRRRPRREEDDDRPAARRRRRDDDEDEDRPAARRRREEDDDEDAGEYRRRKRRKDDDEDDDSDRARRRRARRAVDTSQRPRSVEGRVFSGSVVGGGIAMLVAVVWFVGGLFAGIIFFYPPILFIIGLVGFIRGLLSGGGDE